MQPSQFDPFQPELREAAETLEQALAEACASKSPRDADTGELIRVEEMLALASEAARRAIAVRRRVRREVEARAAERGERVTAAEPIAVDRSSPAFHRLFDDERGVRWDVWAVYPETRPSPLTALPGPFQSGWLVFESALEKRRLSPVPNDWQTLPPSELERLRDQAEVAPRRERPRGSGAGESPPPPPRTE